MRSHFCFEPTFFQQFLFSLSVRKKNVLAHTMLLCAFSRKKLRHIDDNAQKVENAFGTSRSTLRIGSFCARWCQETAQASHASTTLLFQRVNQVRRREPERLRKNGAQLLSSILGKEWSNPRW